MFWATLWALVLGFGLSGAVQAFVAKKDMQRVMGDHRPGAVARSTGLGMVSSSCSYAATAMAKSVFQKGADFISSMVFMFASTNLVLELGVVLVVLMGWQFAAAEFIGGPIMIVLLVIVGGFVFSREHVERARRRVQRNQPDAGAVSRGRARTNAVASEADLRRRMGRCRQLFDRRHEDAPQGARHRLRRRRLPRRDGPDGRLERRVPHRPRLLEHARERHPRPVHRLHQLRLLGGQRSDGCCALARRHQLRWRDQFHLRRLDRAPPRADLSQVLRPAPRPQAVLHLLVGDVDRWTHRGRTVRSFSGGFPTRDRAKSCTPASSGTTRRS